MRLGLVIFLLLPALLLAGKSDVGTTAYPFLKIGVGAKAQAMGGAFAGLADDESAAYYNPAGIIGFQQHAVAGSYMNYIADIQSGYLALILPSTSAQTRMRSDQFDEYKVNDALSSFGFSVNYLNYGTIDETNNDGEIVGDFSGSDVAVALTYARRLSDQFTLGGSAKFIYQKIQDYSSDALALDLGAIYRLRDGRTSIGLSAANLGFQLSGLSTEHKDPLPIIVRAGLSHHLRGMPLTASAEVAYPTDNDIFGSFGLEFMPKGSPVALRAGYSTFGNNYETGSSKDNIAGFSVGAGFHVSQFVIDYAFLPYADLGQLHRVSLAHRW
jgi:hypothetical protein